MKTLSAFFSRRLSRESSENFAMVPDAGGLPMKGPPEKSCGCLADVICHATIGESDLRVGDQLKPDVCNIQVKYGQVLSAVTVRDDTREVLKTNRMFDGKRVDVPVCFLKVRVRISEEQDEPVPAGYVLVKGVSTYDRSIDTGGRDPFSKPSKEWVSVPSKDASGESMPAAHKGFSIQLFEIHIERCFRSEEEKASYCGKVFLEEEKCRNYIISCPSLAAVLDRYQVENGSVEGTVVCDQRPDARLIQQLNEGIDKLIAERVEPDYHPNTGKVVLDIVHPSLYPYVRSVTKVTGPESSYEVSRTPPKQAGEGPPTTPSAGTVSRSQEPSGGETKEPPVSKDRWGRLYEDSNFQWLPSVFDISTTGECSIKSYINNLPTEGNAGLVAALEKLFESFLPLFETCYSYIRAIRFNDHDEESTWSGGLVGIPWNYAPDIAGSSLRGRELKVVTKIVEYQLGHEDSFEGVWHVEGMSHESIVMTGLYILDRDEGFDGGDILFKVCAVIFQFLFSSPQNTCNSGLHQSAKSTY